MKPEIEDFKTWTVCVKTSNCFTKNIVFQTFQGHRFFREKSALAPDASSEHTVQRPVPSSLSGRFAFSSGICQVKRDVESFLVCCLEGKGSCRLNLSNLHSGHAVFRPQLPTISCDANLALYENRTGSASMTFLKSLWACSWKKDPASYDFLYQQFLFY